MNSNVGGGEEAEKRSKEEAMDHAFRLPTAWLLFQRFFSSVEGMGKCVMARLGIAMLIENTDAVVSTHSHVKCEVFLFN